MLGTQWLRCTCTHPDEKGRNGDLLIFWLWSGHDVPVVIDGWSQGPWLTEHILVGFYSFPGHCDLVLQALVSTRSNESCLNIASNKPTVLYT